MATAVMLLESSTTAVVAIDGEGEGESSNKSADDSFEGDGDDDSDADANEAYSTVMCLSCPSSVFGCGRRVILFGFGCRAPW